MISRGAYAFFKRVTDIVLSLLGILILSPLLLFTSILLFVTGEHLVIYRQSRVGKDYKEFNIFKFVTMRSDSEKSGTITAKNDPRVLPVGKILRKTKINELPQIFNILFGDMSIVGPRPLVGSEVELYPVEYRSCIYKDNKPGLTGIGSLFFRNEEDLIAGTGKEPERAYREDIMPLKGILESWYRSNKSIGIDTKIVLLTAWAVLHSTSVPLIKSFTGDSTFPVTAVEGYSRLLADSRK